MVTLYDLFSKVRLFKSLNTKGVYEKIFDSENLSELLKFLEPFGGYPFAHFVGNKVEDILLLVYLRAKRNLIEKDLYSFQSEAFKVNAKLCNFVKKVIKRAGVDQTTQEFLYETLTVVLNWNNPIVEVLNRQIDSATIFLMKYWDPEQSDSHLFESGLSKYNLTKGTFSMRSSVSIILAESAILKEFISVIACINKSGEKSPNLQAIRERILELSSQQ